MYSSTIAGCAEVPSRRMLVSAGVMQAVVPAGTALPPGPA